MVNRNEEIMALYAEVKRLKTENDELRLFKIKAVEEAKREADSLMINKILKYEDKIKELEKIIEDNRVEQGGWVS
jgi:ribosomal protein S4E